MELYDTNAAKKSANLSVNSDLLRAAKEAGLNLSGVLEARLIELLRHKRAEDWKAENAAAIEAYNERIAASGTFGDEHRRF